MEIIGGEEFERGLRAALASRRLLACCKVLQARMSEQLHAAYYRRKVPLTSLKSHFKDPVVAEVYAVIALAEGRDAAADPFLGWSLRAIAFSAERSPDPYAYVPDKSFDALEAAGIATVGDLLGRTPLDLMAAGVGPRPIGVIQWSLGEVGLALARQDGPPPSSHPIRATPVARLLDRLQKRIPAALEAAGIATVGDLLGRTAGDVLGILGMGPTLLEQLENELRSHGLALAERSDRARAI